MSVTWVNFEHWRNESRAFEDMSAFQNADATFTGRGDAVLTHAGVVTSSFLPMIGAKALKGRPFLRETLMLTAVGIGIGLPITFTLARLIASMLFGVKPDDPGAHGRDKLIAAYSGYGNNIILEKGDGLAVHHDKERGVVTLEYQVHGKTLKTGAAYDNRFVSIVTITNRQIVRWRDYMDSLAVWQALTGK